MCERYSMCVTPAGERGSRMQANHAALIGDLDNLQTSYLQLLRLMRIGGRGFGFFLLTPCESTALRHDTHACMSVMHGQRVRACVQMGMFTRVLLPG